MDRVEEILAFWFGADEEEAGRDRSGVWFGADPDFDRACAVNFLLDCQQAIEGALDRWTGAPRSSLALVLLLDQFPRNIFRGSARAFASDRKALGVARQAIARGFDLRLNSSERLFVYLPFEHSEQLDDQFESLRLFRTLAADDVAMTDQVEYAEEHLELIRRFGRFPWRNLALRRDSSAAEIEYLTRLGQKHGIVFGQRAIS